MMFKKKNLLSKLWLKHTDRAKYKTYKWELVNYKHTQYTNFLLGSEKLNNLSKIIAVAKTNNQLNLTHSGNAGDIIYALPTIKKIQEVTGVPVNLYLILGKPLNLPNYSNHPLGNVMLNQKMADMLFPLLRSLPYIDSCEIYSDQRIDVDLDYFRAGLVPQDRGNIARWCGYITGVSPELWKSWLTVTPDTSYGGTIVLARSGRYQNKQINYKFLNKYNNLAFIGVESEYNAMRRHLPNIKWVQVDDFMQLAQIIAGCKFFIGNQSFPYSIAEGLKVPRILEVSFEVINVVPEGENGHDFLFQEHFEWLVGNLNGGE
jgi:hypothetical protein